MLNGTATRMQRPSTSRCSAKARAVALIALCEVMALSLWFSATAVLPALKLQAHLDAFHSSLFTSLVSVGFVCGTLTSAVLGLADRMEPHRFFRFSAWAAALANLGLLVFPPSSMAVLACRFVTGVCMAGVYPVGMKMVASWAKGDMGLLVGILVGALTLGSASPHLFNAVGGLDWRIAVVLATASAAAAGWLVGWARLGPNHTAAPPFQPGYVLQAWRNAPLRLANFGYLGHQWELYAMWGVDRQLPEFQLCIERNSGRLCQGRHLRRDRRRQPRVPGGRPVRRPFGTHHANDGGDGRERQLRLGRRLALRCRLATYYRAVPSLGCRGGSRLGAILVKRHRAVRPGTCRYHADHPDLCRIPADLGNHPSGATAGRGGWLAVGLCRPGTRPFPWGGGNGGAAAPT